MTPIRRLESIAYWVIEDPADIGEFVGTVLRREWEADLRGEGRDPASDQWLAGLLERRWRLEILRTSEVKPELDGS